MNNSDSGLFVPDESEVMPGTNSIPRPTVTTVETTSSPTAGGNIKPKRKLGPIIAAVLGILLLIGGVGVGLVLVNQRQLVNQKAASSSFCDSSASLEGCNHGQSVSDTCGVDSGGNTENCIDMGPSGLGGEACRCGVAVTSNPSTGGGGASFSGPSSTSSAPSCESQASLEGCNHGQAPNDACGVDPNGVTKRCNFVGNGECICQAPTTSTTSTTSSVQPCPFGLSCQGGVLNYASLYCNDSNQKPVYCCPQPGQTIQNNTCVQANSSGSTAGTSTSGSTSSNSGSCNSGWCTTNSECTNAGGSWSGQSSYCTQGSVGPVGQCCLPSSGGGSGGSAPAATPKPECGQACTTTADCKGAANGGTVTCTAGICQNAACIGKTIPGANCDCSAQNACGQPCNASVGLCQAGSVCRFVSGPSCTDNHVNTAYCFPASSQSSAVVAKDNLPAGWSTTICSGNTPGNANFYVLNPQGQNPTATEVASACLAAIPTAPVCSGVHIYDTSWNLLTSTQLSQLTTGSTIRFDVATPSTGVDKARFTINGTLEPETTSKRPNTNDYYFEYVIPNGVTTFNYSAEIHDPISGNWF